VNDIPIHEAGEPLPSTSVLTVEESRDSTGRVLGNAQWGKPQASATETIPPFVKAVVRGR